MIRRDILRALGERLETRGLKADRSIQIIFSELNKQKPDFRKIENTQAMVSAFIEDLQSVKKNWRSLYRNAEKRSIIVSEGPEIDKARALAENADRLLPECAAILKRIKRKKEQKR